MLLRNPGPAVEPDTAKRLLNKQAVREVEAAEAAYNKSIEKLSALAGPRIEHAATPLMVSYREKLLLLDGAIAECRANIEQNRWNAHLRQELLEIYQQKQRTLQDVVGEESMQVSDSTRRETIRSVVPSVALLLGLLARTR